MMRTCHGKPISYLGLKFPVTLESLVNPIKAEWSESMYSLRE